MNQQLRIPVSTVTASLIMSNGSAYDVEIYVPSGSRVADVLSEPGTFMPTTSRSQFRMFSRSCLAAIALSDTMEPLADLPTKSRRVRVRMTSGIDLIGRLSYLASESQGRVTDHLNDSSPLFTLMTGGFVTYVAKQHVAFVEELS